jgi:superfamily II DNA helicase RecQ
MFTENTNTPRQQILSEKCQEVQVSPEIAISPEFRKGVISKKEFYGRLRVVVIDEAHCISLWGGSFRLDYAALGVLRGRLPRHVPFIVASATLPDHILDDIRTKLQLSAKAKVVRMTNARPNVALSCRAMKHPQDSNADLRFLIPTGATKAEQIDISLVYCNQRIHCEDAVDHLRLWAQEEGIDLSCIAFYHAKVGEKRKRELEEKLRRGEIRILVCTDAVGMVRELDSMDLLVPNQHCIKGM